MQSNTNSGWISLYRNIQNHWIFENDKWFKWWVIMLFEVNHKPNKMTLGYEVFEIKRGYSANSLRTWARLFDTTPKTVLKFFNLLEKDAMINKKTIGKGKQSTTLVNITHYDNYQGGEETQSKHKVNAKETQSKREVPTNNNVNNDNNVNNKYGKDHFFKDWNELRIKHLKKPSNLKSFQQDDAENLNDILKDYNPEDIRQGLIGLFKQENLPNGNTTMQSNPKHFLKYFNSYYAAYHDQNKSLYGKKELEKTL